MHFAVSTEAAEMQRVVAELLDDRCTPEAVRAGCDSEQAHTLLASLAQVGVTGATVDPSAGGLGLDENYLVPIMTEIGRAAAPLPLAETVAVAPVALARAAADGSGQAADLLTGLAAGDVLAAADPQRTGRIRFGRAAKITVVGGFDGVGSVSVLDLGTATRTRLAAIDQVADPTEITNGRVLAEIDDSATVRAIWRRGVLAAAAELIGLSRRMLDMTVAYVAERRQFGVPIGSFQAIKHHLATALIDVEFAAPTVAAAGAMIAAAAGCDAERLDNPTEIDRQLATAKALASDAALAVAEATLQCHGAIAYTTEYDWHLYAKRAWALAAAWGSAAHHRATVAHSMGLAATG